jgi:predicted  nucleic acid-binding Zn-ribbon protein
MPEPQKEQDLRHQLSDLDEEIDQKYREIQKLQNRKVDLRNQLFVAKYNRGVRE